MAQLQYVEVEQVPKDLAAAGGGGRAHAGARWQAWRAWLNSPWLRRATWTGSMIISWYALSTLLSTFNKLMVGKELGLGKRGPFPAPLLLSGVQFSVQTLLAKGVFGSGLMKRTATPMAWGEWSRLVLPNGFITGLDIGLSNKSLVYITMSFYTMCKSTTPIFLLAFAFLWGLEQPSWSLAGVMCVIVTGLLLLVRGETRFNATGFALVMTAACMSGLRFTLTQVLLHGHAGHGQAAFGGPLEVLEALTPVMAVTTLTMSLLSESLWSTLPGSPYFDGLEGLAVTAAFVCIGAVVAFLMVWAEFEVIRDTSALTFMIAGVVKEIITILAAIAIFGDDFGLLNGLGLGIAIFGVLLFNMYKLRRLRDAGATEVVIVRRPSSAGGMSDDAPAAAGGGGGGSGDGDGAAKGGGGEGLNAATLVSRAGSGRGPGGGGSHAGSGWRHDGGGAGGSRLQRGGGVGGGGGGSGGSDEEGDAAAEDQPLLLAGVGGGLSSGPAGTHGTWR
ncbi:MAG: triose-phosphate transporter family-domain-containing protein, partial [Monoraphidium minutum]